MPRGTSDGGETADWPRQPQPSAQVALFVRCLEPAMLQLRDDGSRGRSEVVRDYAGTQSKSGETPPETPAVCRRCRPLPSFGGTRSPCSRVALDKVRRIDDYSYRI